MNAVVKPKKRRVKSIAQREADKRLRRANKRRSDAKLVQADRLGRSCNERQPHTTTMSTRNTPGAYDPLAPGFQ
jgi:hypothetical protein